MGGVQVGNVPEVNGWGTGRQWGDRYQKSMGGVQVGNGGIGTRSQWVGYR